MPRLRIKRGTRAQIETAKAAGQLAAGELYLVTDENRLAFGTATNAYEETASGRLYVNAQTGTTYTFVRADAGKMVTFGNAAATTVTVPANSSVAFPVGTVIQCGQEGAGKVTFAPASGVTLNSQAGNRAIAARYVGVMLVKTATDTWTLYGNLIA